MTAPKIDPIERLKGRHVLEKLELRIQQAGEYAKSEMREPHRQMILYAFAELLRDRTFLERYLDDSRRGDVSFLTWAINYAPWLADQLDPPKGDNVQT